MPTPKKSSKTKSDKAKSDKSKSEVLKPRKGVEKISEEKLEEISGGRGTSTGQAPVSWAIDRS
jgi:hypothetical protein